jgi:hypothetical protein
MHRIFKTADDPQAILCRRRRLPFAERNPVTKTYVKISILIAAIRGSWSRINVFSQKSITNMSVKVSVAWDSIPRISQTEVYSFALILDTVEGLLWLNRTVISNV